MTETSPSLLQRVQREGDDESWRELVELYLPLIRRWLRRHPLEAADADDLVQEVFGVVVRKLPGFEHNQRTGAFRAWLRTITVRCARDFWRSKNHRPDAKGGSEFLGMLDQLEDPNSEISRRWDREHDLHVTRKLLERLESAFAPQTWKAFQRVALDGSPADEVAEELGMTVNAVFIAKSRVLSRLRQEAAGLVE